MASWNSRKRDTGRIGEHERKEGGGGLWVNTIAELVLRCASQQLPWVVHWVRGKNCVQLIIVQNCVGERQHRFLTLRFRPYSLENHYVSWAVSTTPWQGIRLGPGESILRRVINVTESLRLSSPRRPNLSWSGARFHLVQERRFGQPTARLSVNV